MGRDFYVRDNAPDWPMRCVCGSQAGPIVDTYVDIEGYGRVYACAHCVARYASALGYRTPEVALEQEEEIARLRGWAAELEQELAAERSIDRKLVSVGEMLTHLNQAAGNAPPRSVPVNMTAGAH